MNLVRRCPCSPHDRRDGAGGAAAAARRRGGPVGHVWSGGEFETQASTLFWATDRSWCVASEVDFDSTLVGGTTELVDVVLRSPDLEAWPVEPDDSLASDGDAINR